jgi:predicted Zn-dependent protease
MEDEQQADRVLRYLRGEMSREEEAAFQAELKADPKLYETYQFHKQVADGEAYRFKQEKKALLQALEAEQSAEPESATSKRRAPVYLWLAAGIGAAAVALVVFLILPGQSAQELSQAYFSPFPDYTTETYRGGGPQPSEESESIFDRGMRAYRASEYSVAINRLQEALEKGEKPALSHFYLANALMAKGKPDEALQHLTGLKPELRQDYQIQQQWYLALAYLQTGNEPKALPILNSLTEAEHFQHKRAAKKLRAKLE